jgi:acyl carrier protein
MLTDTGCRVERIFRDALRINVPSATTDVIGTGLLDSLALVTLLVEIEQEFCVAIPLDRLEMEELRTVERIAAMVDDLTDGR